MELSICTPKADKGVKQGCTRSVCRLPDHTEEKGRGAHELTTFSRALLSDWICESRSLCACSLP
eukprot:1157764-Pelagomonas_calceolata.AAC.4